MSNNQEAVYDLESVAKLVENKEDNDVDIVEDQLEDGEATKTSDDVVDESVSDDKAQDEQDDVVVVEDETTEEKPKKKKNFKRDKRIEGLLKKNTAKDKQIEELERKIELLMSKEDDRSKKENDVLVSEYEAKRREAFETSDYEEFQKYDEMIKKTQGTQYTSDMSPDDMVNYFKTKAPWYQVDEARTHVAENLHAKVINDPQYKHLTPKQQLDFVADKVNEMPQFKKNPYQNVSTAEPSSLERSNTRKTQIKRSELEYVRRMFPNLSEPELIKRTKELVEAVNNNVTED